MKRFLNVSGTIKITGMFKSKATLAYIKDFSENIRTIAQSCIHIF